MVRTALLSFFPYRDLPEGGGKWVFTFLFVIVSSVEKLLILY